MNKFTALVDFRDKNIEQKIINWKLAGGCGIKFHPYLQKIDENEPKTSCDAAQADVNDGTGLIKSLASKFEGAHDGKIPTPRKFDKIESNFMN